MTDDEENVLVAFIDTAQKRGFPRPDTAILDEVQKILKEDGRKNPFILYEKKREEARKKRIEARLEKGKLKKSALKEDIRKKKIPKTVTFDI